MALGMDGNDLHVKVPVSLGPVDSYLDLTMTGQVENNVMSLTVTGAKLGENAHSKILGSQLFEGSIQSKWRRLHSEW